MGGRWRHLEGSCRCHLGREDAEFLGLLRQVSTPKITNVPKQSKVDQKVNNGKVNNGNLKS
jgi:hypothetical protein